MHQLTFDDIMNEKTMREEAWRLILQHQPLVLRLIKKKYMRVVKVGIGLGEIDEEDPVLSASHSAMPQLFRSVMVWLKRKPAMKVTTYIGVAVQAWAIELWRKNLRYQKSIVNDEIASAAVSPNANDIDNDDVYAKLQILDDSEKYVIGKLLDGYTLRQISQTKSVNGTTLRRVYNTAKKKLMAEEEKAHER